MELIKPNKNSYITINSLMNNCVTNTIITENDLGETPNICQSQTLNQEEESKKLQLLRDSIQNQDSEHLVSILESNKFTQKSLNIALLTAVNLPKSQEKAEIIQSLLSFGANPNIENPRCKRTILMISSSNGDIDVINTLLGSKINVNARDKFLQNCLFYALNSIKGDNVDIVSLLISSGVEVNTLNCNDESPLLIACKENLKNSARVLVENNANVNVADKLNGNNPLHYAVENGNLDLVKLLVIKGVNFKAINCNGQSALNIALKKSKGTIYSYLNDELQKRNNIDKRNFEDICKDSNKNKGVSNAISCGIVKTVTEKSVVIKKNNQKIEINTNTPIINPTCAMGINSTTSRCVVSSHGINNGISNNNVNINSNHSLAKDCSAITSNISTNINYCSSNTNTKSNMNSESSNNKKEKSINNIKSVNSNNNKESITSKNKIEIKYDEIKEKDNKDYKDIDNKKIMPFKGYKRECKKLKENEVLTISLTETFNILSETDSNYLIAKTGNIEELIQKDLKYDRYLIEHFVRIIYYIFNKLFINEVLSALEKKIIEKQDRLAFLEEQNKLLRNKLIMFDNSILRHHIEEEFSYFCTVSNYHNNEYLSLKGNSNYQYLDNIKNLNTDSKVKKKLSLERNLHESEIKKMNKCQVNSPFSCPSIMNSDIEIIKIIPKSSNYEDINKKLKFNMNNSQSLITSSSQISLSESQYNNSNEELNNCRKSANEIPITYSKIIINNTQNINNLDSNSTEFEIENNSIFIDELFFMNLTEEIISFKNYSSKQVKLISFFIEKILLKIKTVCSESLIDYEIIPYGSYATNLALKWSDLDLVLHSKIGNPEQSALKQLYISIKNMNNNDFISSCKFIDTTSIPIIKLQTSNEYGNIYVDISLKDNRHMGLKCINLVKTFIADYPCLPYLVISLKQILKHSDLNDPFKGGISSYGIILMIVYFLQNYSIIKNYNNSVNLNYNNYGKLLFDFLDYFGNYFDGGKLFVSVYCRAEFSDKSQFTINPYTMQGQGIVIIDPMCNQNIVSKSAFKYPKIKYLFSSICTLIKIGCECRNTSLEVILNQIDIINIINNNPIEIHNINSQTNSGGEYYKARITKNFETNKYRILKRAFQIAKQLVDK